MSTVDIINNHPSGLYHLTCEGLCSWYQFATKIFEILKIDIKVEKTTSAEFPSNVNRPSYSVLENSKYNRNSKIRLPNWDVALNTYLTEDFNL